MIYGSGSYRYEVVEGWGHGPNSPEFGMIPSISVDSRGRVYAFRRSPDPCVLVFERDGRFVESWGHQTFAEPHAIWVSSQDEVYCTDREDHTVRRFDAAGRLLATFGAPHQVGAPGMPFNKPAKAIVLPDGEMFVADGYGQHRIHRFAPDGRLMLSWGEKGAGPGQFILPHGVMVDSRRRVLVADREPNHRLQIFTDTGTFLTEWTGLLQPMDVYTDQDDVVFIGEAHQRISIFSPAGELLSRWGEKGTSPGEFSSFIHGIWVDIHGDLYIADEHRLQKFARV